MTRSPSKEEALSCVIDTDKYEGHIEGPWTFDESSFPPHVPPNIVTATCQEWRGLKGNEFHDGNIIIADFTDINDWRIIPTTRLIADAPLLLEEVKRLRELLAVTPVSPDERIQVLERDLLIVRARVTELDIGS